MSNFLPTLVGLTFLSFLVLLVQAVRTKEYILIGLALPRLYLTIATVLYILYKDNIILIHYGVVILLIGDSLLWLLKIFLDTSKQNAYQQLLEKYTAIEDKFKSVVENSCSSIFTLDMDGVIEYANPQLRKTIGNCKGKYLMDILGLPRDYIEILKYSGLVNCKVEHPFKGEVRIMGTLTKNGHETITGSLFIS
jgi:hypothetical protein